MAPAPRCVVGAADTVSAPVATGCTTPRVDLDDRRPAFSSPPPGRLRSRGSGNRSTVVAWEGGDDSRRRRRGAGYHDAHAAHRARRSSRRHPPFPATSGPSLLPTVGGGQLGPGRIGHLRRRSTAISRRRFPSSSNASLPALSRRPGPAAGGGQPRRRARRARAPPRTLRRFRRCRRGRRHRGHPGHGRPRRSLPRPGRHIPGGGSGRRRRLRGPGPGHRRSKAEGLRTRYGLDDTGTRFWDVHAGIDEGHGQWMLEALALTADGPDDVVTAPATGRRRRLVGLPRRARGRRTGRCRLLRRTSAASAGRHGPETSSRVAPGSRSVAWEWPWPRHNLPTPRRPRTARDGGAGRPEPPFLSHRQVLIIFSGLMLGMLLAALDQTIVATALPTIVGDLHGLDHLSWVVTAYLLTTTLSTPLYGKISDLYGRKKIFQVAIVIFLIGSALSGLARNMDQLIAFRALQGLGGGGLMALAMAIIGDIVSPRQRGRYQGYFGGVFAFASIGGPLAGGFFVDHLTWRWIFYINIPVGILALVITSRGLPSASAATRPHHRLHRLGHPRRRRHLAAARDAVGRPDLRLGFGGHPGLTGFGLRHGGRLRLVGATGHRAHLPPPPLRQPHSGRGLRHHPCSWRRPCSPPSSSSPSTSSWSTGSHRRCRGFSCCRSWAGCW